MKVNERLNNSGISNVQFAPWPTEVQDDSLNLIETVFDMRPSPGLPDAPEEFTLPESATRFVRGTLRASFADARGVRVALFEFGGVIAFRVLDENGLQELWDASAARPRPARATFRVRGHGWTRESALVFAAAGSIERYSHMVATDDLCIEVVCSEEPVVTVLCA